MIRISSFDWDEHNLIKCRKHGLSVDLIEAFFFSDPDIFPDVKHSQEETRFVALGPAHDRFLFVAFTIRARNHELKIRIISARYANKSELEKICGKT